LPAAVWHKCIPRRPLDQ